MEGVLGKRKKKKPGKKKERKVGKSCLFVYFNFFIYLVQQTLIIKSSRNNQHKRQIGFVAVFNNICLILLMNVISCGSIKYTPRPALDCDRTSSLSFP